jgi:hypothetical protein
MRPTNLKQKPPPQIRMQHLFWIAIGILALAIIYEYLLPSHIKEGFETKLVSATSSPLWANFAPRRGDIGPIWPNGQGGSPIGDTSSMGPGFEAEEAGHQRDPRYFQGYTDVQRLGADHDFCRVVSVSGANNEDRFVACALAGTDGLSSVAFKTEKVSEGLRLSRDDYMRDIDGDGRGDYCRILRTGDRQWEAMCRRALDTGFSNKDSIDPEPPKRIQRLLNFYTGALWWFRFADDMNDYAESLVVSRGNGVEIDETRVVRLHEEGAKTEGLHLDGTQFLRIGEPGELQMGEKVRMRAMRAFSIWVKVDEFTNNAHVFDFGNGAGKDNVWLGLGKPNEDVSFEEEPRFCESTMPAWPSGPQAPAEVDPKTYMKTSDANVDEFECIGDDGEARFDLVKIPSKPSKSADLIYEIWDATQRAMRVVIKNAVPIGKWVNIAVSAKDTRSFRPDLNFYINGRLRRTKEDGFLPQTDYMTRNYIGKSNWADVTSQYEDKDELFKGSVFDFRGYAEPINEKVGDIYKWGKEVLKC